MITEPTVELIGQTHVCTTNMLRILERKGGIENYEQCKILQGTCHDKIVEFSGRLCYNSASSPRPGGSKAYHDHIKETGHFSVHEHANFTFYIGGVSRSLTLEMIRHRHLSPSQRSQRFVDESGIEVVVPPLFIWDDATEEEPGRKRISYDEWFEDGELEIEDMYHVFATFAEQVVKEKYPDASGTTKRKLIREAARCVLPNMAETELTMTGNARAWRHFLNLRGSRHADMEIRRLAVAIARVLQRETTYLFDDINFIPIKDLPGEVEITGIWEGSGEVRALKKRIAELESELKYLRSFGIPVMPNINDEAAGCFIRISQNDDGTVKSVGIDTREWPLIRAAIDELVLVAEEQNKMEDDTGD